MGARLIALALAAALAALPVAAAPIADGTLLRADDPAQVADYLRQIGYRPDLTTDQTGDPRIVIGFAGMQGSIWFNDCDEQGRQCESIRMQVGLLTDHKLSLQQVNEFNASWRFATLSLDEESDPLLNHDLWLAKPGIPAGVVGRTVQQFEAVAATLRDMVNAHEAAGKKAK